MQSLSGKLPLCCSVYSYFLYNTDTVPMWWFVLAFWTVLISYILDFEAAFPSVRFEKQFDVVSQISLTRHADVGEEWTRLVYNRVH